MPGNGTLADTLPAPPSPPPWSTADIAHLLGISRGGVVYLLRSRGIDCRVSGGRYLIGPSDLAAIRERKVGKPKGVRNAASV